MLGVVVLVVAIFALRQPKGHVSSAASTKTTTTTTSPSKPPASSTRPAPATSTGRAATSPSSSTAASGLGTSSTGLSPAQAKQFDLVVLNNTDTSGLAEGAAQRFEAGGWTVTKYENYQNTILSTCAYYDPDVSGAKAAAKVLQAQYPTIKRVQPQFSELGSYNSPIVVILTPDYQAG